MRFNDMFTTSSNQRRRTANKLNSSRAGRRKPPVVPAVLRFEALEPRQMLTVTPVTGLIGIVRTVGNQLPPPPPTSMTQLAQDMISSGKLAAPSGPTYLYLNFDGWKACKFNGNNDVTAFTGSAGDIASILYRTAEAYAPFDVIVQQISGDGNYSTTTGATTVFIGNSINGGGDFTPNDFMDYPHSGGSTSHVVNSDAYDVAFVSQGFLGLCTSTDRDAQIANDVAHEAGHTFGLAHVRTDGKSDYPDNPSSTPTYKTTNPPDVMSYDSNNDFFSNTTYNVTDANGTSTDTTLFPDYDTLGNIVTQNSFTYLQTVLGARPATSQIGLADENVTVINSGFQTINFVDPGFYGSTASEHAASISSAANVSGCIARAGDYAAYQLSLVNSPPWAAGQELAVTPGTGSTSLSLMVFDDTFGTTTAGSLVASTNFSTPLAFRPDPTHTYTLVVGGAPGSTGAFNFTAGAIQLNLQGLSFAFTNSTNVPTGKFVVASQTDNVIKGTFTPPGTNAMPIAVSGYLGGAVNGLSSISFNGRTEVTTVTGPRVEQITTTTTTAANFAGQAHLQSNPYTSINSTYILSGQGTYKVTRQSTTFIAPNQTIRSTTTPVNLSLVNATAKPPQLAYAAAAAPSTATSTTATKKTTTAKLQPKMVHAKKVSQTSPIAVDHLMAGYAGAAPVTSDSNECLLLDLLATLHSQPVSLRR
jgi:hypothetical protein